MNFKFKDNSGRVRGQEVISFTINSDFKLGNKCEVTVVLLDRARNNLFYEKHVLRLDDDSEDMLEIRQSIDNLPTGRIGEAIDRVGVISGNKVTVKTAPASTMIRLDKIDLKLAIYTIAQAFVSAMFDDKFGDYAGTAAAGNQDIQVTFPSLCVEQRERDGSAEYGKTMTIGGSRTSRAQGDPIKVSFDINHCSGT
jgi:hypothetical protein